MDRKWTYLMFAVGGLLLAYLFSRTGMWAWDYLSTTDFAGDFVGRPRELLTDLFGFVAAGGVTFAALRNQRLVELANEVTFELSKVTWPTRIETGINTVIVIVTVIVSSAFLGLFDFVWSWAARMIYG